MEPVDGAQVLNRASGETMVHRDGIWEAGVLRGQEVRIEGQVVLRQRQAAISDPQGGSVIDNECRIALAAILVAMRSHGLID